MKTAKIIPLQTLASLWPQGPTKLFFDLEQAGFKIDPSYLDNPIAKALLNDLNWWSQIQGPASSNKIPQYEHAFAFINKEGRLSPEQTARQRFSMLFVDPSQVSLLEELKTDAHPHLLVVACAQAPAVFDWIFRKMAAPEWVAPSSYQNPSFPGVSLEPGALVGPDCELGDGTVIESNCRIGARVKMGRHCRIGAGSRIADDTVIGDECVFAGPVCIGGQGFGLIKHPGKPQSQMKHIGRVVIGDRVRLGAFVAIDRGLIEDTYVGSDTMVDNVVQIAHNCTIGASNVICGFVGLSGTTHTGQRVTIAGMVGTGGHVSIADDVTLAAQTGVSKDIRESGVYKGYPPKKLAEALKQEVLVAKLPEAFERLKALEKELKIGKYSK